VVIAVVSILIATSGGGSDTAGGCDDRQPDDQGFSGCMRELAGAVPDHNECSEGATNPFGGGSIEANNATVVTCEMQDGYMVMYMHFGTSNDADGSEVSGMDNAKAYMDTINDTMGGLGVEPETGQWEGDGLAGDYTVLEAQGIGVLVFQVKDSPLVGALMQTDISNAGTGGSLKDFYEDHVKPGSDGGA
jgi:hypothetical protein